MIPDPKPKACRKCGLVKPLEDYWRSSARFDGRHSTCIDCESRGQRQRRWDEERTRLDAEHAQSPGPREHSPQTAEYRVSCVTAGHELGRFWLTHAQVILIQTKGLQRCTQCGSYMALEAELQSRRAMT